MKAIGITQFLDKSFDVYDFEGDWLESFGQPEKNFIMSIYGSSGHGKTEFAVQLTKYLASFGKVLYCSYEQGIGKSLQDAVRRNEMTSAIGKVIFTSGEPIDELIVRLKRKASPRIVIIDSLDYAKLTMDQFKLLKKTFPRKSFIIVSWSKNDVPKSAHAKDIEYMSCIKILVKNFKAHPRSRFGGNKPFVIWDKKDNTPVQGKLF